MGGVYFFIFMTIIFFVAVFLIALNTVFIIFWNIKKHMGRVLKKRYLVILQVIILQFANYQLN